MEMVDEIFPIDIEANYQELNEKEEEHIPMEIMQLNSRGFQEFPQWILLHEEMLVLNLNCNGIPSIPAGITWLDNLVVCNLSMNSLRKLDPAIFYLSNLKRLDISHNRLYVLPSGVGKLKSLEKLDVSYNQLKRLPASIGSLESLKDLCVSHNRLQYLPSYVVRMEKLVCLNVSNNRLKTLPRLIGVMDSLRELVCFANKIRVLPDSLWTMGNLRKLRLSENRVGEISPEIVNMTGLKELNICSNRLYTVPAVLGRMFVNGNLRKLEIAGNPLEYIPPQVARALEGRRIILTGIYNDGQNIHNSTVQQSLQRSIENIFSVRNSLAKLKADGARSGCKDSYHERIMTELIMKKDAGILAEETLALLLEYLDDPTVHTVLGVTFEDVFMAVWNQIHLLCKDAVDDTNLEGELLERLNEEMADSDCKCFTGRITRLVNVLSGFTPLVSIIIPDNEQIAVIIQMQEARLLEAGNYTVEEHQKKVRREMLDRGYADDVIETWIAGIE